jgi:hypothetical protein
LDVVVEVGSTDDGDGIRRSGKVEHFTCGDRSREEGEMVGWVAFGKIVRVEGGHDGQSRKEGMGGRGGFGLVYFT